MQLEKLGIIDMLIYEKVNEKILQITEKYFFTLIVYLLRKDEL